MGRAIWNSEDPAPLRSRAIRRLVNTNSWSNDWMIWGYPHFGKPPNKCILRFTEWYMQLGF